MKTEKTNSYTGIITTASALGGGIYALRHPSEETCRKIEQSKLSVIDTFQGYKDSFDMAKATPAIVNRKINMNEYQKTKDLYDTISGTLAREQEVKRIQYTPIEERNISLGEAIKTANASRRRFRRAMLGFNKELQNKLNDAGIFNKEKFTEVLKETKSKLKIVYKELSKSTAKGLVIGTVIGLALSLGLKLLTHKNSKSSQN